LYDTNNTNIEESFFHTWDYLQTYQDREIVLNSEKFQFCADEV